jgi:hypothetical protein
VNESELLARIVVDPKTFAGKPIIRGRRLAVEHVLGMLAAGDAQQTTLACAHEENRILGTLDKEFGELTIVRSRLHCGILRLVNAPGSTTSRKGFVDGDARRGFGRRREGERAARDRSITAGRRCWVGVRDRDVAWRVAAWPRWSRDCSSTGS